MVVGADGSLIHARHECGTTWRADGRGGEEPRVPHALGREAIEVRRPDFLRAVATELRPQILGNQPEDVRLGRAVCVGCDRGDEEMRQNKTEQAAGFHSSGMFI